MKIEKRFIIPIISIAITTITLLLLTKIHDKGEEKFIYNTVEQIKELATSKQIYREILYSKETKDLLWIPISNKEFLISLDYAVTGGIDLSKGIEVIKKKGYYLIRLPKSKVLSIDAIDSSITQYYTKERFSKINHNDYFKLINRTKEKILKGEEIEDLLAQSERNAENILKSLLSVSGIEIKVEFKNSLYGDNR